MEGNHLRKEPAIDMLTTTDLAPLFWRPARLGVVSAWWEHVPFAHWLVAAMQPKSLVELGTHNGVSYSAFCEAVSRLGLDSQCHAVDTWQGDEHAGWYGDNIYAELRTFHDAHYGSFSTLLRMTFDEAATYFEDASVDLLHIDGLHSYEAVLHDFETWLPKMSERGVVLFHDINVRGGGFGVWKLWSELQQRYASFTFVHGHGLGLLAVGGAVCDAITRLCSLAGREQASVIRERFALIGERWNFEYRDAERTRELGRHAQTIASLKDEAAALRHQIAQHVEHAAQLERAVEAVKESHRARDLHIQRQDGELNALRIQGADLETARMTLHNGLQDQLRRADVLTAQIEELSASRAELIANNEALRMELDAARRGAVERIGLELADQHHGMEPRDSPSEMSELRSEPAQVEKTSST
jgi:regulator of replication initiation timing